MNLHERFCSQLSGLKLACVILAFLDCYFIINWILFSWVIPNFFANSTLFWVSVVGNIAILLCSVYLTRTRAGMVERIQLILDQENNNNSYQERGIVWKLEPKLGRYLHVEFKKDPLLPVEIEILDQEVWNPTPKQAPEFCGPIQNCYTKIVQI